MRREKRLETHEISAPARRDRVVDSTGWDCRNPRASAADVRRAGRIARKSAREFARRGASAVLLAGSWARGNARRFSDIDLWVFGLGSGMELRATGGFLLSIHRYTVREARRELQEPKHAGLAVLAWREAVVLHDPRGVGARLQRSAREFRWRKFGVKVDHSVSSTLAEWGEEAVKLTRLIADGELESASVQRNLLVDDLAHLIAMQRRLLYREEVLWRLVADAVGRTWRSAQRTALGLSNGSWESTCEAALALYRETAVALWPALRPRDRKVIRLTCAVIGHPVGRAARRVQRNTPRSG